MFQHRAPNTGCTPRRSVHRKRRPTRCTTLQSKALTLANRVKNRPWKRVNSNSKLQVQGGKLRALGVTGTKRSPLMPDVPTIAEAGLPNYQFET